MFFQKNLAVSNTSVSNMIQFQQNTHTDDKTGGQTEFHRILLATTEGSTSKTAADWHLKVKGIEYHVGLTKNDCITVRMQKISSSS